MKQRTLGRSVSVTGYGVHTGEPVFLKINPAPEGTGLVFRRMDLNPCVDIRARVENVVDTRLCTTLGNDKIRIKTVEHLLAAFAGLGVDNAIIELDRDEVPILDGSSRPFVECLLIPAGIIEQDKPKKFLQVLETVRVEKDGAWAEIKPYSGYRVSVELDYQHPILLNGIQKAIFEFSTAEFIKKISGARTFGFLSDYEKLRNNNLALGANFDNTVVLDEYRVLNEEGLRYHDEFVKHKILDMIGDLYLAGYGILGEISGFKVGHALNNKLLNVLLARKTAWKIVSSEQTSPEIQFEYERSTGGAGIVDYPGSGSGILSSS